MILRPLFYLFLGIIVYCLTRLILKTLWMPRQETPAKPQAEELVQNPFCQTYIPKRSALRRNIDGRECFFCNQECYEGFLEKKGDLKDPTPDSPRVKKQS